MVYRILKIGMFNQVLCKEVVSTLPECFMGMDIMSGWGTLPLPTIVDDVLIEAIVKNIRIHGIK